MLVEMKKLVLLAHSDRKNKILRAIHRSKIVMVSTTREIENTISADVSTAEEMNVKAARVASALHFLEQEKKKGLDAVKASEKDKSKSKFEYTPVKVPFQSVARISFEEFTEIPENEAVLTNEIAEVENIQTRYSEINSDILKSKSLIEQLDVYKAVEMPFTSFADTKNASVVLGCVPIAKKPALDELIGNLEEAVFEVYGGANFVPFDFVCLKENVDSVLSRLQPLEFSRCGFSYDSNAETLIAAEYNKIKQLEDEKLVLLKKSLSKEIYILDWKKLYDFYLVELAKQKAAEGFRVTKSVFVLEGWFPKCEEERLAAILKDCCDELVCEFREPEENEEVPTLVKSKKLFDPYEDVTNMYSAPNYREDFDPNPIMALFYFLFFGIMLSDAGYGILLALGGFIFYKLKKPTPGKGRLLLIIAMGGISTLIWGALFGGWFALDISNTFLAKLIWFEPLGNPILMLALCLALGFFQIVVGMALNAYNLIRKGRVWDAVFEVFTWFSVFVGLGILVLNMLLAKSAALKYVAIAFIALGLISMVLGNARGKKGVGGKIKGAFGGLSKVYNGVNILSDVLSYSRLFGLGLSGGVVGMVVNKICQVIIGLIPPIAGVPIIGIIIAIPIFIVGHVFNIGISTLGAYVHNCRLQYIEFYGKFYTGSGELFKPLGNDLKYTYIDNKLSRKELAKV